MKADVRVVRLTRVWCVDRNSMMFGYPDDVVELPTAESEHLVEKALAERIAPDTPLTLRAVSPRS